MRCVGRFQACCALCPDMCSVLRVWWVTPGHGLGVVVRVRSITKGRQGVVLFASPRHDPLLPRLPVPSTGIVEPSTPARQAGQGRAGPSSTRVGPLTMATPTSIAENPIGGL